MGYSSRHHRKTAKRVWQPLLIMSLVVAAGGTSGWVALNTQNHAAAVVAQETGQVEPLEPNRALEAADVNYQVSAISAKVEEIKEAENADGQTPNGSVSSQRLYTLKQLRFSGVINWNGYKFTYYSQKVLPGGGLRIPGRHVNADGYVCDGEGYIVLANSSPKGSVIPTPFGAPGKVYDSGTQGNHYDVYTS